MYLVCLDVEGVLLPEIWINVAKKTGIKKLLLTTRDVPDYDKLMQGRLAILKQHGLKLKDIQDVINVMEPLPGALQFLNSLRERTQVILLSDTFTQFAQPLMKKLGWPTLFCNTLIIGQEGGINDYKLRQQDGKRKAVKAIMEIGYQVIAIGDSYNDISMLKQADIGILYKPPQNITKEFPQFPVTNNYQELEAELNNYL